MKSKVIVSWMVLLFACGVWGCSHANNTALPAVPTAIQQTTPTSNVPQAKIEGKTETPLPSGYQIPDIIPTTLNNTTIDWDLFSSLPADYYILFIEGNNAHILSRDGSIDRVLIQGDENLVSRISIDGNFIEIDSPQKNAFDIVDLETRDINKFSWVGLPDCINSGLSPNRTWMIYKCNQAEGATYKLFNLKDGFVKVVPSIKNEYGRYEDRLNISWSPDGNKIVYFRPNFTRFPETHGSAELMSIDTSCLDDPVNCPLEISGPFAPTDTQIMGENYVMWSPDSRYFATVPLPQCLPLLFFDLTAQQVHFGRYQGLCITGMSWSPDGKWIALSRDGIYLVPPDGNEMPKSISKGKDQKLIGWLSTYPRPVFQTGSRLFITGAGDNLRVRATAGANGAVIGKLYSGDVLQIIDGPMEADGSRWWQVKAEKSGLTGWCVENPDWYAGGK